MKAVLISTGNYTEMEMPGGQHFPPLIQVMERPFIQHLVENLAGQGFGTFEVVLCQFAEAFESLLGDGTRWGVRINYHLAKDPSTPYRPIKFVETESKDEPLLLVHCDRLIEADVLRQKPSPGSDGPVVYFRGIDARASGERPAWSGWAWISGKCRANLPDDLTEKGLLDHLLSFEDADRVFIDASKCIGVGSYPDLLAAHKGVFEKKITGLRLSAREIQPGIWISRNVALHPTAKFEPPVYVGENSSIGRGVRLGPLAAVAGDCVVDTRSIIHNSVVFANSYVGEALEIQDAVVDRNRLINVRFGSEVTVTEDFILASLAERRIQDWLKKILSQFLAAALLILLLPLFAVLAAGLKLVRRNRPLFHTALKVRLPAPPDPAMWRVFSLVGFSPGISTQRRDPAEGDFSGDIATVRRADWRDLFLRFLPAIVNVARGELRFVGVDPRTAAEIEALPRDWRSIYLKSKGGIVSEALVNFGPGLTRDELYAAETYYTVSACLKYDLKLMVKYIGLVSGLLPRP